VDLPVERRPLVHVRPGLDDGETCFIEEVAKILRAADRNCSPSQANPSMTDLDDEDIRSKGVRCVIALYAAPFSA
jgi:hypothetical protein